MQHVEKVKLLLEAYLWVKQNAMALRDGGDTHHVFDPRFASCVNVSNYLERVHYTKHTVWYYDCMGKLLAEFCAKPQVAMRRMVRLDCSENWPFGHPDNHGPAWGDKIRLEYIDWVINKLEGELNNG